MIDAKARPQILEHLSKSLTLTVYETRCGSTRADLKLLSSPRCMHAFLCPARGVINRWIPGSAKFVALGSYARNTGSLQVCVCVRAQLHQKGCTACANCLYSRSK